MYISLVRSPRGGMGIKKRQQEDAHEDESGD
jgi:hypothetical protein